MARRAPARNHARYRVLPDLRDLRKCWDAPPVRFFGTLFACAYLAFLVGTGLPALWKGDAAARKGSFLWTAQLGSWGLPASRGMERLLEYHMYLAGEEPIRGRFPDTEIAPALRQERWLRLANQAAQHPQDLTALARFLVHRLPSPPLRMGLSAFGWRWDRNLLGPAMPQTPFQGERETRKLGFYEGLTRSWTPEPKQKAP